MLPDPPWSDRYFMLTSFVPSIDPSAMPVRATHQSENMVRVGLLMNPIRDFTIANMRTQTGIAAVHPFHAVSVEYGQQFLCSQIGDADGPTPGTPIGDAPGKVELRPGLPFQVVAVRHPQADGNLGSATASALIPDMQIYLASLTAYVGHEYAPSIGHFGRSGTRRSPPDA